MSPAASPPHPPAAGPSPLAPPPSPRRSSPRVWAVLEPLSDAARSALPATSPNRRRYLELKTDQSTYCVGRSAENDLALRNNAAKISTHHATLERITPGGEDDGEGGDPTKRRKKKKALAKLEDSSRNGTSINGTKVRALLSLPLILFRVASPDADTHTHRSRDARASSAKGT